MVQANTLKNIFLICLHFETLTLFKVCLLISLIYIRKKKTNQTQKSVLQTPVAHEIIHKTGIFPIQRPAVQGNDVGVAVLGEVVEFIAEVIVLTVGFYDGGRQRIIIVLLLFTLSISLYF